MRRALAVAALGLALAAALTWLRPGRRTLAPSPATSPPRAGTPPSAPTSQPHPAAATSTIALRDAGTGHVAVVLRAGWGSGPGQLGRRADPESVTEGPMSFLAGARGIVVLDNVNQRLARFAADGTPRPPIALPNAAAQDLARAGARLAVLDRLRDGAVALYDDDGRLAGHVALAGPGIAEPAAVSGIFTDRDDSIVAEREHGAWLTLVDPSGAAAARASLPGRPTRDGGYVSAALLDRAAGTVVVHRFAADGRARWDATVAFGAPLLFIDLLDADAAGIVYLGVHTARESSAPPYALVDETLHVAAIDGDGRVAPAQLSVAAPPPREEAFRDLSVGDDGTIYWMRRTPDGVVIEAYRL